MLKPFRQLITYISDSRGAKITLIAWIVVVITLSLFAPSAKDYETNGTGGSIKQTASSEIAEQIDDEQFPSEDGLTALLVFHRESKSWMSTFLRQRFLSDLDEIWPSSLKWRR